MAVGEIVLAGQDEDVSQPSSDAQGLERNEAGLIPPEWSVRPLFRAVTIASGQVDPRYTPFDQMVLVAPDHVESGTGRLLKRVTAAEQGAISGKYCFSAGDVIYSKIRPYLRKAFLADFSGLCSADMYPFRPAADVWSRFLLALLLGHRFSSFAESVSVRSGIPKVNREELAQYSVSLPPLPEQRAIAAALADADRLIGALEALIAKKRAVKLAAMQHLLTGRTRLPGFGGEWERKQLGTVADIFNGGTPRTEVPAYWDGGIQWCTPTDITGSTGKYLTRTQRTISKAGLLSCSARLLPVGALLLCSRATIGELKIAAVPVCTNQGFKSLVSKTTTDSSFLYYLLLTMKPKMIEKAIGSTFLEISKEATASLELTLPATKGEQVAIAAVLSDMDAEIAALARRREKTAAIKRGMMQVLLTGRVRLVAPGGARVGV